MPSERPKKSSPEPKSPMKSTLPTSPSKSPLKSSAAPTAPGPSSAARRRSERKRGRASGAAAEISPAPAGNQRVWSDEEGAALLRRAAEFRSRTGSAPTAAACVAAFFDAVGPSLPPHITQEQVYNKLRRLRRKHLHSASPDPALRRLCLDVWADSENGNATTSHHNDKEDNDDDHYQARAANEESAAGDCPRVAEAVEEYCRMMNGLSAPPLLEGLRSADPAKLRALEEKWRRHWSLDMKLQAKRMELSRKLLETLAAALKDSTS